MKEHHLQQGEAGKALREATDHWYAVDREWSAELTRVHGRNACNARYTVEGASTPELKRLHGAFMAAKGAYESALTRAQQVAQ